MAIGVGVSVTKNAAISKSAAAQSYLGRIISDSGTVGNIGRIRQWIGTAQANGFFDPTQMLIAPIFGYKERISAPYSFLSKLYSLRLAANDAAQTTEVNQPYKAGYIPPNEVLVAKNPNGDARFFTHPSISFAANQAWSVSLILNWNGANSPTVILGDSTKVAPNYESKIYLDGTSGGVANIIFRSASAVSNTFTLSNSFLLIGKNKMLTITANGSGGLSLLIDGVEIQSLTGIDTSFIFNTIGYISNFFPYYGSSHYYRIQSGAMTPTQITAEYDLLRSWIPEIESVQIGSQVWASSNLDVVATPLGNVIPEVQIAGAVEKITNAADREFSSDTGFWTKAANVTIGAGVLSANQPANEARIISRNGVNTIGKWIKVTFEIISITQGSVRVTDDFSEYGVIFTTTGIKTVYYKALHSTVALIGRDNLIADIDNISIQELNWSNATEIYDYVYAATSGTAAQKHYAAVKEAAMWCSYDNSTANQSIYGKILNGYAIKLLNLDMITADYGYRPTLQSDWDALETYLGVDAGNDVKHNGTTFWSAPNGGTNSSGLTILPGGYRNAQGAFVGLNDEVYMITADETDDRIGGYARLIKD